VLASSFGSVAINQDVGRGRKTTEDGFFLTPRLTPFHLRGLFRSRRKVVRDAGYDLNFVERDMIRMALRRGH
jgi:hypothetical protein